MREHDVRLRIDAANNIADGDEARCVEWEANFLLDGIMVVWKGVKS